MPKRRKNGEIYGERSGKYCQKARGFGRKKKEKNKEFTDKYKRVRKKRTPKAQAYITMRL